MSAADLEALRPWLPYWWVDTEVEPEKIWDVRSVVGIELVMSDLELWVAEHAEEVVFVHAGVVAVDGRALLLPGRSHDGKTTLTAALLRAGAAYGSDEYAVLDPSGRVHPYPRPLAIRGIGNRQRVPASALGAETFTGGLPVGGVAVLRYEPGAGPTVQPISSGIAVLRLFDCTICARSRPQAALDTLIAATAMARAIEGERGEVDDVLPHLLALMR